MKKWSAQRTLLGCQAESLTSPSFFGTAKSILGVGIEDRASMRENRPKPVAILDLLTSNLSFISRVGPAVPAFCF